MKILVSSRTSEGAVFNESVKRDNTVDDQKKLIRTNKVRIWRPAYFYIPHWPLQKIWRWKRRRKIMKYRIWNAEIQSCSSRWWKPNACFPSPEPLVTSSVTRDSNAEHRNRRLSLPSNRRLSFAGKWLVEQIIFQCDNKYFISSLHKVNVKSGLSWVLKNDAVSGDLLSRLVRVVPLAVRFWPTVVAFECLSRDVDLVCFFALMKTFHQLNTWVADSVEITVFTSGEHLRPFPRAGVLIGVFDTEIRHFHWTLGG